MSSIKNLRSDEAQGQAGTHVPTTAQERRVCDTGAAAMIITACGKQCHFCKITWNLRYGGEGQKEWYFDSVFCKKNNAGLNHDGVGFPDKCPLKTA